MIGIIGYRNHSLNVLKILKKLKTKYFLIYCRDLNKIKELSKQNSDIIYTNNLNDLNKCKKIFICSTSITN